MVYTVFIHIGPFGYYISLILCDKSYLTKNVIEYSFEIMIGIINIVRSDGSVDFTVFVRWYRLFYFFSHQ